MFLTFYECVHIFAIFSLTREDIPAAVSELLRGYKIIVQIIRVYCARNYIETSVCASTIKKMAEKFSHLIPDGIYLLRVKPKCYSKKQLILEKETRYCIKTF